MSTKFKIIWILFCVSAPVAVICLLYAFADRPNRYKNGFSRTFASWQAIPMDTLLGEKQFTSVCGVTKNGLYVQLRAKQSMLWCDWSLHRQIAYVLPLPPGMQIRSQLQFQIDSPLYHIFNGNGPDIFSGSLTPGNTGLHFHYNGGLFLEGVALPGGSYLLRGFDNSGPGLGQSLFLWDPFTGHQLKKYGLSPPSADAGIGSEGHISYDTSLHRVGFVQFYKNGMLTLDSSLDAPHTSTTIDTVHTGSTKFGQASAGGQYSLSANSPLFIVNGQFCMTNGKIYVNSFLKADNEEKDDLPVIDIYDGHTLRYLYSFHLPGLDGKRIVSLRVLDDKLAAIYTTGLVTYRLQH